MAHRYLQLLSKEAGNWSWKLCLEVSIVRSDAGGGGRGAGSRIRRRNGQTSKLERVLTYRLEAVFLVEGLESPQGVERTPGDFGVLRSASCVW